MRGFAHGLLLAAWLGAASPAAAQPGVYLPPAPSGTGGEDSIETAEGTRCRQSINSSGPYLDVGVTGSRSRSEPMDQRALVTTAPFGDQALAYARVTVPIGQRPRRLDCSRLYELEITRLRREIELMRMAAE